METEDPRPGHRLGKLHYRGWSIYWREWMADWGMSIRNPEEERSYCHICNNPIETLARVYYEFAMDRNAHWQCKYPNNRPGAYWAWWIAADENGRVYPQRLIHTACSPTITAAIPGGFFERGQAFDIPNDFEMVTEFDHDNTKEFARSQGLQKMFLLIDAAQDHA